MFWKPITINNNDQLHWQFGPLKLWVTRTIDEWQTAVQRNLLEMSSQILAQPAEPPAGLTWMRWAAMPDDHQFCITPTLPDRPVIVRPESSFAFPPQSDLLFFVSIPLTLRLGTGSDADTLLRDEPTLVLSNSWFGDPMEGLLCYALKTTARRTVESLRVLPHLLACPIHIRNRSENVLDFERLCLHTAHLRVYHDGKRFWTNQVEVTYGGESYPDSITYTQAPPDAAPNAEMVTEAREPARKGLLNLNFSDLKAFVRM